MKKVLLFFERETTHFLIALMLSAMVPITLAGCNITASENKDSSEDDTEPDDPPTTETSVKTVAARGEYLSNSADEHSNIPIRWVKKMPLTVYFQPVSKNVESYRPEMKLIMHTALASWTKKTNGVVSFRVVNQLPADITVTYEDPKQVNHSQPGHEHVLGYTTGHHSNWKIKNKEIVICLPEGSSNQKVLHVSEHELGHALGLSGHSPVSTDVMFPDCIDEGTTISAEDVRTVERLYKPTIGDHKNDRKFDKKHYIQTWTEFVAQNICIHSHSEHNTCKLQIEINNTGRMFKHKILDSDDYAEAILDALSRLNYFPPPDLEPGDWLKMTLNVSKDHDISVGNIEVMHAQIPASSE